MKLTVLKLNILDSLNKCQYPYVLNLFSPGFEKSYPTSVKGEKKHYCRHCYIPWNVDRMQMCYICMQWQNSHLLRTVSSPRTNEFSKNLFCAPCAGKTLLALSTSRIVCQDKSIDKKVEAAKKHQLMSFALPIIIVIFLSHLLVSTVTAYIYSDSHFVLVNL